MTKNKFFWGILLLIAGIVILLFAFLPDFAFPFAEIPVWKLILAGVLLYWIIKNLIFGSSLRVRLDHFFPLALGYVLFYSEINEYWGHGEISANTIWIVILASLILSASLRYLLPDTKKNGKVEEKTNKHENSLSDRILYLDATNSEMQTVTNNLGKLEVSYQNTDVENVNTPLFLTVHNELGKTIIHVPDDWCVMNNIRSSMGNVKVRLNKTVTTRTITVSGSNELGDIQII